MATPSSQLRAAFAHAVDDSESELFLSWLAQIDARIREIAPPFDLLDCTDPGWVELWDQDASMAEALDTLRAVDFEFEGFWIVWSGQDGKTIGG